MIPYRKWKFLSESIFNRTLGITNHQSLGLISPFLTAQDGAQEVTSNQDGEENVLVDEKRSHGKKKKSETETCKYCGSKMKKEHMDEDEYEGDEDESGEDEEEEEEEEGEGEDEEGYEGESGEGEDEEGEDEDEEGEDGEDEDEDEDEGDMDESKKHKSKKGMKHMKCMKCMKESFKYNFMKGKKGKKGKKDKKVGKKSEGDVAADGSIDAMVKKLVKKGMPEKFAMVIAKKKAEKAKNESSWMNDIFGGDPNKKNYDGINEMVEQNPMVLKKSLQDAEFVAEKGGNTALLSIINKIKPHVLAGEKIDQNLYDAIVDGNPNEILPAYQAASKSGKF